MSDSDTETPYGDAAEAWLKRRQSKTPTADTAESWLKQQYLDAHYNELLPNTELRTQCATLLSQTLVALSDIPEAVDNKEIMNKDKLRQENLADAFITRFTVNDYRYKASYERAQGDGTELLTLSRAHKDDPIDYDNMGTYWPDFVTIMAHRYPGSERKDGLPLDLGYRERKGWYLNDKYSLSKITDIVSSLHTPPNFK